MLEVCCSINNYVIVTVYGQVPSTGQMNGDKVRGGGDRVRVCRRGVRVGGRKPSDRLSTTAGFCFSKDITDNTKNCSSVSSGCVLR